MACLLVNRPLLHILVLMLTFFRLQQQVDAGPSLPDKQDSTYTKAFNLTSPISKVKHSVSRIRTVGNIIDSKRGWEAIGLLRRKRGFTTAFWKHEVFDKAPEQNSANLKQDEIGIMESATSKWRSNPTVSNNKRGWDGIDFPWGKRSKYEELRKSKWNGSNDAFEKLANNKKKSQQEWETEDETPIGKVSVDKPRVEKQELDSVDATRKRGWDGIDFFDKHKDPNMRGWFGGDLTVGKRSGDKKQPRKGWASVDFTPVNYSDDKDLHKRGWDGIDFNFGKRSNDLAPNNKRLDNVDFSTGKRSDENESSKRGWDGVDFPFRTRINGGHSKQDWAGMDVVLGVGMDTGRARRVKRGWEGLNLHYRVINAYGPSQSSDFQKRGWEGVDTCVCCHNNHRVLCCLACNTNNPQPKPRITTKSYKNMFYVRDTVCKCCYATKVSDCCDLCEIMS